VARKRTTSGRRVLVHLLVVVGLTVAFVVLFVSTPPNTGANIGLGLVGLPLLALGLPWSLPTFVNPYARDDWSDTARAVVDFGPAYLNVALHALWWRVSRSRR
jgi:hypothetical protein